MKNAQLTQRLHTDLRSEKCRHEDELLAIAESVDPHWALTLIGEGERHYHELFRILRDYRKRRRAAA